MQVCRVEKKSNLEKRLAEYAAACSWIAGKHLAMLLAESRMVEWECAFVLLDGESICGFCTLLKTDYYPENRYSPWISTVFVEERCRGARLSGLLIEAAAKWAGQNGFERVYIPSDMIGFYEKYGFEKIDELVNYDGDMDHIFMKEI